MTTVDLSTWQQRGQRLSPGGHDLFVVDTTRGGDNEAMVLLHGFPTSSYDFAAALPTLRSRLRVVAHDHVGFGLSSKTRNFGYRLFDQADQAVALWRHLGLERIHIVAHDYGTSVATELVARHNARELPFDIASLVLCNGSVRLDLAKLTWPQRLLRHQLAGPVFARLASRRLFVARLRKTFAEPDAVSHAELEVMWQLVVRDGGRAVLSPISQYLRERVTHADRWLGALADYRGPSAVIWGDRDPIAVPAIAEALADTLHTGRLEWLHGVGHYPMVEAPARWADAVLAALDE